MQINTSRFGRVDIQAEDILVFPEGLAGLEDYRHWVILADVDNPAIVWLQSVSRADVALPVVNPGRFVLDYQVRVTRGQLEPLHLASLGQAHVLSIVSRDGHDLHLNLRAPLIVNLQRGLGRQVTTSDDQPLCYKLARVSVPLRKSA